MKVCVMCTRFELDKNLKKHIVLRVFPRFFPASFFFEQVHRSTEAFVSQGILFPKRLSFHKGWCCGSQWKRIAELWRVVWVVGGDGFRGKWFGF